MSSSEPGPRGFFFFASRHTSSFIWGGVKCSATRSSVPVDDLDYLYEFNTEKGLWIRHRLRGQHPPGICRGASVIIGKYLYTYGGQDKNQQCTGSLYRLNLEIFAWEEISNPTPESPQKKHGCCMVEYNGKLVVYAGNATDGFTTELHLFDIAFETWSHPVVTGDIPKPTSYCTLTKIFRDKAVQCGGWSEKAVYELDLSKMSWTKRCDLGRIKTHYALSAECLGFDRKYSQLLIMESRGVWLLDIDKWQLNELKNVNQIPYYHQLKRSGHGVVVSYSSYIRTRLVLFGGKIMNGNEFVADTTQFTFRKRVFDYWWQLTSNSVGDSLEEKPYDSYNIDHDVVKADNREEVQHIDMLKECRESQTEIQDSQTEIQDSQTEIQDSQTEIQDSPDILKSFSPQAELPFASIQLDPQQSDFVSTLSPLESQQSELCVTPLPQNVPPKMKSLEPTSQPIQLSKTLPTNIGTSSTNTPTSELVLPPTVREDKGETLPDGLQNSDGNIITTDITTAIITKKSIRRKLANILLQGLPGSGKTSLLDRLLKQPIKIYYSSTNISDKVVVVEIKPTTTHTAAYICSKNTWNVTDFDESLVSQLDVCSVFIPEATNAPPHSLGDTAMSDIKSNVREVLDKHNINKITDLQTKKSLYIRDTGGQIEFQESLSLLISGPSIFIFVLKTDADIHTKNTIQYRSPKGNIINEYQSTISNMDALVQFLASVSAIKTSGDGLSLEDGTLLHEPIVFIVGTHIDKLGKQAKSVLDKMNAVLHEMIVLRKFSQFVHYANALSKEVMYLVDNTCNEDQQFEFLRSDINQYIHERDEFLVEYPVGYLLFCLELQSMQETVLSMDTCKNLAEKFCIKENEIGSLLHFLHYRVGIVQYYNVEGISDIIIKEPQILFNKVTELIHTTFLSTRSVRKNQQEEFRTKGILDASIFTCLLSPDDQITSDQLLQFFIHLRLAVPFTTKDGMVKYFVPCALNHVQKCPSDIVKSNITPLVVTFQCGHCPKGLLGMLLSYLMSPDKDQKLTFSLLEDHIFQDQVSLHVNSSEDKDQICLKSHLSHLEVQIFLENYSSSPSSTVQYASRAVTPIEVCNKVRLTLESCLRVSLKKLRYDWDKVGVQFSLKCPVEHCMKFHAVEKGKHSCHMHCNTTISKILLPDSGSIWFNEGQNLVSTSPASPNVHALTSESSAATMSSHARGIAMQSMAARIDSTSQAECNASTISRVPEFNLRNLTLLKWIDKFGQHKTLRVKDELSSRWREVGDLLGLSSARIEGISTQRKEDAMQCCRDILSDWLTNGSLYYEANWDGLMTLLNDSKLNATAKTLQEALASL